MIGLTMTTQTNKPTTPAPAFESAAFIPPEARLAELAKLALEAGVSADNVRAYLSARYAVRPASVELVQVSP